jgi:hypothetical protein
MIEELYDNLEREKEDTYIPRQQQRVTLGDFLPYDHLGDVKLCSHNI